jgi:hypothetical protein
VIGALADGTGVGSRRGCVDVVEGEFADRFRPSGADRREDHQALRKADGGLLTGTVLEFAPQQHQAPGPVRADHRERLAGALRTGPGRVGTQNHRLRLRFVYKSGHAVASV